MAEFGNDEDITIIRLKPLWDGYSIDYIMRFCDVKTEYVCMIETDVFPIHKNWLYVCINLIKEYGFSFVGGLLSETSGTESIYPPNKFYWLSQYLRVGKTEDYKELAMEGGFTRFHARKELEESGEMKWGNDDWKKWASEDYQARGSDNAVVAHYWEDKYRENNKFSFGNHL